MVTRCACGGGDGPLLVSLLRSSTVSKQQKGDRSRPKRLESTTSQRFELWRAEPNRFLIYLLNHSDTMSLLPSPAEANWRRGLAR
jgi:hypothetical protein